MKTFKEYLQEKYPYSEKTLQEKGKHIENWKKICIQGQELEKLSARELLSLLEQQKHQYKPQSLNNQLKTLEQYYNYLKEAKNREDHPLRNFRIKTDKKLFSPVLLNREELDKLYSTYSQYPGFEKYYLRNKIILGLLIYQGAESSNLRTLRIEDIDLSRATIVLRSTGSRYTLRELPLEGIQIASLQEYLQTKKKSLGLLFSPKKDFSNLYRGYRAHITKTLEKLSGQVSIKLLRYSRIALWKKQYNLREVQYKAGYRSIVSLEKYNQEELEQLQQSIKKYHPF